MRSSLDLHIHSCYSDDGEFAPRDLAGMCMRAGLRFFAIADHNSTRGVAQALSCCKGNELKVIPAVELDCRFRETHLHVLGYGIDYAARIYDEIWHSVVLQEQKAAEKRKRLVRALGINFTEEALAAVSKWGLATGEMIAEAAMACDVNKENPLLQPYYAGGSRNDNPYVNFFWDYCSDGKPAHVPVDLMDFQEAVKIISETGGAAVLAHPGNNIKEDPVLLDELVKRGICGIEAFSSYHDARQTEYYLSFAQKRELLVTCGSDFHGKTKPNVKIGGVSCGMWEQEVLNTLQKRFFSGL
ncbi:MAG: PHP domain-containing protein [Christensenella sp.]|nr:PHP domain-containing protein [Christensenella sp.]